MTRTETISLPCPECGGRLETKDSRPTTFRNKPSVRRRRACTKCSARFTTFEIFDRGETMQDERVTAVMRKVRTARDALEQFIEAYEDPKTTLREGVECSQDHQVGQPNGKL